MYSLKASVAASPAPWLVTSLGSAVALLASFGHLTPAQTAAVYSLAAAAGTIATAARTRPVAAAAITGAAAVVLGDLTLFGLPHMSADQRGAVVGVLTFALGTVLHLIHVPVADSAAAPPPPAPPPPAAGWPQPPASP